MKKKLLTLLGVSFLALCLGACGQNQGSSGKTGSDSSEVTQTFTVAFEVDGTRYRTLRVKSGEKITEEVPNPTKEGYRFTGWYEGTTLVDLTTYVVTKNVTFTAKFEESGNPYSNLNVNDVKEAGKEYYMVFGWWEVNDPADPEKKTSYLTESRVQMFYYNMINLLTAKGATEAQINAISFRNYSSDTVANMGTAINADADVDIMIGVGNNINSTAGVALYGGTNDSKFQTQMSVNEKGEAVQRYVALLATSDEFGKEIYDWLDTDTGHKSFLDVLTAEEIEESLHEEINLSVTVHGDTNVTTVLTSRDAVVEMPTITVPTGHHFTGFALTADGEVVLEKALDAQIKYTDVKDLVPGAQAIDLYPIFEEDEVAAEDLVVYVQTNNITDAEAALLEARFNDSLQAPKNLKVVTVNGNAETFANAVHADSTVDVVIGGNNPVNNFTKHQQGPTANAGAKHFANTSRKVIIKDTVSEEHLTLAKAFYDFVVADAVNFEVHSTFWTKNNEWVTADEVTAIKTKVVENLNTYLAIGNTESLLEKYNVTVTWYEATNTKVADLGAETLALRNGKGTDLLIGCGANVTTAGGIETVEIKDIPTTIVAGNRKVAIIRNNGLVKNVYDLVFKVAEPNA